MKELCNSAMQSGQLDPFVDGRYAAFAANGLGATAPDAIKTWVSSARSSILTQVAAWDVAALALSSGTFNTSSNVAVLTGVAPLEARTLLFNSEAMPIIWTSTTNWLVRLPVDTGTNPVTIAALSQKGLAVGNSVTVTVINSAVPQPALNNIVFNELAPNTANPDAEYVELFNRSTNTMYDLSGWRINGLGYTFPVGSTLAPRGYLLLARNRLAIANTYGATVPVFDTFAGNLQGDGDLLELHQPGLVPGTETLVDQVRYQNRAPWPVMTNGLFRTNSLQLADAMADNMRASNWRDNTGWRFFSYSGSLGNLSATRLAFHFDAGGGEVYLDDITFVVGSVPAQGTNLLKNGGFEEPLLAPWTVGTLVVSNSMVVSNLAHTGNNCFKLKTGSGSVLTNFFQDITAVPANTICSVGFWYLPGTNGATLNARVSTFFRPAVAQQVAPAPFTPGNTNSVLVAMPPYPELWLNEVKPMGDAGLLDGQGEAEPWLELYNSGANAVSLDGFFLTDDYASLGKWSFPTGSVINPGEFKVLFLDGESNETTPGEWHTGFRVAPTNGSVALSRSVGTWVQLVDYLNYDGLSASLSYGDVPDGQGLRRSSLHFPTPGATNNPALPPVRAKINEWMASNTKTLLDVADNTYADWFELFNPAGTPADLSGYWLTDSSLVPFRYRIPDGVIIPPGGYLLIWADNDLQQTVVSNNVIHADFRLAKSGSDLGLYAPDGQVVDLVTFGPQVSDVSQGRYPNGSGPAFSLPQASPGLPNELAAGNNTAPMLGALTNHALFVGQPLAFTVMATDADLPAQSLTFRLESAPLGAAINPLGGQVTWTPTAQQLGTQVVTVVVADSGVPSLSTSNTFQVLVGRLPEVRPDRFLVRPGQVVLTFDTLAGRRYRVQYKTHLREDNWTDLGVDQTATANSLSVTNDVGGITARFYRIVVQP
jgi:hypothetical protein